MAAKKRSKRKKASARRATAAKKKAPRKRATGRRAKPARKAMASPSMLLSPDGVW